MGRRDFDISQHDNTEQREDGARGAEFRGLVETPPEDVIDPDGVLPSDELHSDDQGFGAETEDDDVQRRGSGRIKVSNVRVKEGVVLDASSGGLRIQGKLHKSRRPGSRIPLEVSSDDEKVMVGCEVRWVQRKRFRPATFGVSFVDLSEDRRRRLFSIIRRAGAETRCRWMAA